MCVNSTLEYGIAISASLSSPREHGASKFGCSGSRSSELKRQILAAAIQAKNVAGGSWSLYFLKVIGLNIEPVFLPQFTG